MPKGNTTSATYDTRGQLIVLDSPDSRRTEYRYDLGGNLAAKETANLRATGDLIRYEYNFGRLERIHYPQSPAVIYVYGDPGAADNGAGRIIFQSDESGTEQRAYDKLGNVVRTVDDFVGGTPNEPHTLATSEFTFDSFGRTLQMIYPDKETLKYTYDKGGLLLTIQGTKAGLPYQYVNDIGYDEFEQRVRIRYGNGVESKYSYTPEMRRLGDLNTDAPATATVQQIQRLHYGYDPVGNISNLNNNVPVPPSSAMGGPTTQTFQYDDLYQLTNATGTYQFAPTKQRRYTMGVTYDSIGNIAHKTQNDTIVQPPRQPIPQKPTTYDFAYAYGSTRPHAATHIGTRTYHFDASGNQTGVGRRQHRSEPHRPLGRRKSSDEHRGQRPDYELPLQRQRGSIAQGRPRGRNRLRQPILHRPQHPNHYQACLRGRQPRCQQDRDLFRRGHTPREGALFLPSGSLGQHRVRDRRECRDLPA